MKLCLRSFIKAIGTCPIIHLVIIKIWIQVVCWDNFRLSLYLNDWPCSGQLL